MGKSKSFVFVFSLFCCGLLFCEALCCLSAPTRSQTGAVAQQVVEMSWLQDRVIVRRDGRGIPYIEARNEADLYFAQGYVTASDRLWQMDLLRRTARGELAEVFGNAVLDDDKLYRKYGFVELCESALLQMTPRVRHALESYADGVNAFINSCGDKHLPTEFQLLRYKPCRWTSVDSLLMGKLFAESLSSSWPTDIFRASLSDLPEEKRAALFPDASPLDVLLTGKEKSDKQLRATASRVVEDKLIADELLNQSSSINKILRRSLERAGLYAKDLAASNGWVVSGRLTASGKPMLANDPHLRPSAPSIWYMTHLRAPGLHAAGVTVPGLPGIIIGHNERISWGATNFPADAQDLYRERFDPQNPRRYMTSAGWQDVTARREEIKVRKSLADSATNTVDFDVTITRHGPVFLESGDTRYALRWTALDKNAAEFEAFYFINRARDWREFTAALKRYSGPPQNFIYADLDGHIGFHSAGLIPTRKSGDGSLPYDGATGAGDWHGCIPFEKLPHLYDPLAGVIITANNRIVGKSYPVPLPAAWAAPYRARRIADLLENRRGLTVNDFQEIQADTYSFADFIFTREILRLARPLAANSREWGAMLSALEKWDGKASPDSTALALACKMREAFQQHILLAVLGKQRADQYSWPNSGTLIDRLITERPHSWLPKAFDSYEAILLDCYRKARAELSEKLGPDESLWTWGRTYQQKFFHPMALVPLLGSRFAIAPLPQNAIGSESTVNMDEYVSMRLIADLSDWDKTRQTLALGQSGDPSSPHWLDQMSDWRAVKSPIFPFNERAILGITREKIIFVPAVR